MVDELKKCIINVQSLTLLVSAVTLIVTIWSFAYHRNRDKKQIKSLIKRKKAQLAAMELSMRAGMNVSEIGSMSSNVAALKADIEQLEEQL